MISIEYIPAEVRQQVAESTGIALIDVDTIVGKLQEIAASQCRELQNQKLKQSALLKLTKEERVALLGDRQ